MTFCDHKFIDSKRCLKCGVHIDQLRAQSAAERAAFDKTGPVHTIAPRTIADPARARAHSLAEQSINTIAINLDEIDQKDYAEAVKQLLHFINAVTSDMAENKLDTGGVMLLGAACITVLREAILKWPNKLADVAPVPLPVAPAPPERETEH